MQCFATPKKRQPVAHCIHGKEMLTQPKPKMLGAKVVSARWRGSDTKAKHDRNAEVHATHIVILVDVACVLKYTGKRNTNAEVKSRTQQLWQQHGHTATVRPQLGHRKQEVTHHQPKRPAALGSTGEWLGTFPQASLPAHAQQTRMPSSCV